LLDVRNLEIRTAARARRGRQQGGIRLVHDIGLSVAPGELVCLVGESGSGKTVTGQAILGLASQAGLAVSGEIMFEGLDLAVASPAQARQLRGRGLALIPQEPSSALDPLFPVGGQVAEAVRRASGGSARAARRAALGFLADARVPEPARRAAQYPHELSGGLCQRVAIAMALAGHPRLIVADEPTSALDATTALQLLELLDRLRSAGSTGMLLITHDIGVAARADRIVVMYAGRIVEQGPAAAVLGHPRHPYTAGLIGSVPRLASPGGREHPGSAGVAALTGRGARLPAIAGGVPSPAARAAGCPFRDRCRMAAPGCEQEQVLTVHPGPAGPDTDLPRAGGGPHLAACWRVTPATPAESLAALWATAPAGARQPAPAGGGAGS
jgi:oligopeptide/dipeptide ABC transporter ATP-binding protein